MPYNNKETYLKRGAFTFSMDMCVSIKLFCQSWCNNAA